MLHSNKEEQKLPQMAQEPKIVSDESNNQEPGNSSREDKCSICLGPFENLSTIDSCLHKFCFTCIVEWSKVRHACPLCKIAFRIVMHSIQDQSTYKSFILPPEQTDDSDGNIYVSKQEITVFLDQIEQFCKNLKDRKLQPKTVPPFIYSSRTHAFRYLWSRSQGSGTSALRYNIYAHNLHVDPDSTVDGSGRVKECSPAWYRENPAQTHHLVPWLSREFSALVQFEAHLIPRIIDLVIEIVQLFNIRSKGFHEQMLSHTGEKTTHFQHEFYHFARSTYGIMEYDLRARYNDQSVLPSDSLQDITL